MRTVNNPIQATMYADFETTVTGQADQSKTEVWSAAYVYKGKPNSPDSVNVLHSLPEFMKYLDSLIFPCKVYFHNLKFDGSFILTYLKQSKLKEHMCQAKELKIHEYTYMISDKGLWYSISFVNSKKYLIEIWDSLKLAPASLKSLGKSFNTEHQKLEMEYTGNRYPGCPITDEEMAYIKNDVLVLKEVMETLNSEGVNAMTIGSACMAEFKRQYSYQAYRTFFPDLTKYKLPNIELGEKRYSHDRSVDDFIRRSYHGGFCYVNPKYQNKTLNYVSHCDANSHYPSMMHSKSGNYYPVGEPQYLTYENEFNTFRKTLDQTQLYYFVRFQCAFTLKPRHIPMVQIKGDSRFDSNAWLSSSNSNVLDLVMTKTDYEQFLDSYNISNYSFIEAVMFHVKQGIFDSYIDHWMSIKQTSKGAKRQIAKLFLNNLYGKFAASTDSSYKIATYIPGIGLKYDRVQDNSKKAGYIAIGSAITSYARHYTEMLAQNNFDYFVYADTDSGVFTIPEGQIKGIPIDPVALCCWKVESESDRAKFVRQKTYFEHVIAEDGKPVEPYINLKCAGMCAEAKNNFIAKLSDNSLSLDDFKQGLVVSGNLKSKNVDGGILLVDKPYRMR